MKKTLKDYIDDPGIINEPLPIREIHAIRLMIYDEIKDMTPEEHTAHVSARSQAFLRQHGIHLKIVDAHP
jgi:hypothetical protein